MDDEEMLELFMESDDLILIGRKNNRLLLWHSPDASEMEVLDMLLHAYRNFYEMADENKPLH